MNIPQLRIYPKQDLLEYIKYTSKVEDRSFSNMVCVLVKEARAAREMESPKVERIDRQSLLKKVITNG